MCNRCKQSGARKMDKCMIPLCEELDNNPSIIVLGSCCGHGKYPPTIVVSTLYNVIVELISEKEIPRKRKFYKKDKDGDYYIPEAIE